MAQSSIEWTEMTWNATTGYNKISAGCKYCYAEVMARRLKAMGVEKYTNGFELSGRRLKHSYIRTFLNPFLTEPSFSYPQQCRR